MQVKIITTFFFLVGVCIAQEDENCPTFVTWKRNATEKDVNYLIIPIPYVILHRTVGEACYDRAECRARVENIYSFPVDNRKLKDIGYSFYIGGDGSVFEGSGWIREGIQDYEYNKQSIGIAFIGTYAGTAAGNKMLEAAHKLILCGKSQGMLRDNVRVMTRIKFVTIGSSKFLIYEELTTWPEGISIP